MKLLGGPGGTADSDQRSFKIESPGIGFGEDGDKEGEASNEPSLAFSTHVN